MFAYCRNDPINRIDGKGNTDESATDEDDEDDDEVSFWEQFLLHMSRQRKDGHTFSVGYTVGATWGSSGAAVSGCLAVDNSYNYAFQSTESMNAGVGTGTSGGIVLTYTNADNVQDLRGVSSSYGLTLCGEFGLAIDFITFTAATNPEKQCWGISVAALYGAEVDVHASEANTTSTDSWNPFAALYDLFFG